MPNFPRYIFPGFLAACVLVSGFFWLREEVTSQIYRNKLEAMAAEYAELADRYNHAVRQSAITELEVTTDTVAVLIRTIDGEVKRIPTPYNPREEIFVDYLVGNGRIWIRRVFDAGTAPQDGLVIDPVWEVVDWADTNLSYGKVVYRALAPGIWSIQVSGNGALSLEPATGSHPEALAAAPEIRSFEEIQLSLDAEVQSISMGDLWDYCCGLFSE